MNKINKIFFKKIFNLLHHPLIFFNYINNRYFHLYPREPRDDDFLYFKRWYHGKLKRVSIINIFPDIRNQSFYIFNAFNRKHNTSISLYELNNIIAIQKIINAKNVLEIGTYDGNTTLNIAANLPKDGKIYTIDLPENFNKYNLKIKYFNNNKTNYQSIGTQYKDSVYKKKIEQIYCDSAKFDYSLLGKIFDLFIIDGCHDYNYLKIDTENAFKYTRKGGVIIWHDYGMLKDVSKYIDQLSKKINIYAIQGTRLCLSIIK